MEIRFGEEINYTGHNYIGLTNLVKHIKYCPMTWDAFPQQEWIHQFIHTLYMIPRNLNTSVELQRGSLEWEEFAVIFTIIVDFTTHG